MKKDHLNGLEILRFALGIYIVLYHTMHYPNMSYFFNQFVGMGFIATSLFFILSGFILSYVYLNGNGSENVTLKGNKLDFLKKRFANLYPIHIFSLILTIIVISVFGHFMIMEKDTLMKFNYVMYDSNNYTPVEQLHHFMSKTEITIALVMNAFMIQSWNPYYLTFNAPAWSISTLFFMYLLFPYIAPKLSMLKRPIISLFLVNIVYLLIPIAFIYFKLFDMPYTGIINRNPIVRLPEFISGIILCSIYIELKKINFKLNYKFVSISTIFIAACFYFANKFLNDPDILTKAGNGSYYLLHTGLILIPECLIILIFSTIRIENDKAVKYLKYLGGASLPMFAIHIPIYIVFSRVEYLIFHKNYFCLYFLYLLITIITCVYFQEFVVVRTRRWILSKIIKKKV